jgi:Flp pilus assembly protein TadD
LTAAARAVHDRAMDLATRLEIEGFRALQRGRRGEAARKLAEAARLARDDPGRLANLGAALALAGDVAEARATLERAVGLEPPSAAAFYNLALLDRAAGVLHAARERLERALALDPSHRRARFELGVVLMELGAHAAAIAAFTTVLAADPRDGDAAANLARLLEVEGRFGEALARWDAIAGDAALAGRVRCLVALGREAEARDLVRARMARQPAAGVALLKALAGGPRGFLPRRLGGV